MNPFTMAELLLGDLELTSEQLAQLRAINTKYFTELHALRQKAGAAGAHREPVAGGGPAIPEADLAALDAVIARDIRDILTMEQQAVLDRNWPRLRERPVERSDGRDERPAI